MARQADEVTSSSFSFPSSPSQSAVWSAAQAASNAAPSSAAATNGESKSEASNSKVTYPDNSALLLVSARLRTSPCIELACVFAKVLTLSYYPCLMQHKQSGGYDRLDQHDDNGSSASAIELKEVLCTFRACLVSTRFGRLVSAGV